MSLLEANQFTLQKKIFSFNEHFDFMDQQGALLGIADSNFIQLPPKFIVKDNHGIELIHMQGKTFSLHREFTIYTPNGEEIAIIKRKIAKIIGEEFWIEQNGKETMRIFGDFTEHEYQMQAGEMQVAQVHRKWMTVRDQLEVSVTGITDHRIVIGAVIIIEHIEVSERQSNSGP